MKASDIMTLGAATIRPDASLSQALRIMIDHRISALPVLDDNRQLLGIVTEGDFVRSGVLAIDELLGTSKNSPFPGRSKSDSRMLNRRGIFCDGPAGIF